MGAGRGEDPPDEGGGRVRHLHPRQFGRAARVGPALLRPARGGRESRDAELERLRKQYARPVSALEGKIRATDPMAEELETVTVRPKKSDITVALVALAWAPVWRDDRGGIARAW